MGVTEEIDEYKDKKKIVQDILTKSVEEEISEM